MSQFVRAFIMAVLVLAGVSAKADEKWRFREVVFEVHDPDGKPASGVKVLLAGVERDGIMLDYTGKKNWQFVTDAKGRFMARFVDAKGYAYEEATHEDMPGYGGFYMVAESPGTAGGVSQYLWNTPGKSKDYGLLSHWEGYRNEWQQGDLVNVAKPPNPVVIQLKRGITVTGTIRDEEGNPVPNCYVEAGSDLHATSHKGYGGAILPVRAETDAQGNYRLEHVYPNRFDLGVQRGISDGGVWIKTRVRGGSWKEERVDELTPKKKEKAIQVDMVVVKQSPYRYFGKVTDDQGQPVVGAKVTLGVSLHWPVRDWSDDHRYRDTVTNTAGMYELSVESRFVRGIWVEASGFQKEEMWRDDDEKSGPYKPGKYNFQLSK